jgi:three-Cys-motif partner protein
MSDAGDHDTTLPEVGPWAQDKLDRLRRYLAAYTTILSAPRQQRWCRGFVYVDAFAGAGRAVIRRERSTGDTATATELFELDPAGAQDALRVIDGSPRVALSTQPPFTHYVFIERDPGRAAHLQALAQELGNSQRVRVAQEDCNAYLLDRMVQHPRVDWRYWRAVVFLDPFGMQVPWSTIEGLGSTGAIEVFINFPMGMAIQRLLKRSGELSPGVRAKLDAYFGTTDWHAQAFRTIEGLFGNMEEKAEDAGDRLVTWHRDRLAGAFGHVSAPHLVRNSRGGHLYYLIHAGPNATGARIASYVLGDERVRR